MKRHRLFVAVLALLIFASPAPLVTGGGLKEKIQSKLNKKESNIQFQQQVVNEAAMQYEPHYYQGGEQLDDDEQGVRQQRVNREGRVRGSARRPADQSRVRAPAPTVGFYSPYAIYRTSYEASIDEDVVTVEGKVVFEVFSKTQTRIPLVSSKVGLVDVSINRGASFIYEQGGRYYLVIDKPGRYNLDIEFLIKASRERENGPGSFRFQILPAPISQFEFTMEETGVEIFVEPSIKTEIKRDAKKTVAWAVMPNTNSISVRWTKALPKETLTPVKLEPKVYADVQTYASVGEGLIRAQTTLNFSILQAEISNMRIALPEDVDLLDVQGSNLRDWKIGSEEGQQYLDVYLNFGVKGKYVLSLRYESKIGEGSVVAEVPTVRVLGVERETGYLGLAAATNVELDVDSIEHINLIDVKELPMSIWRSSRNPVLLAFKYLGHPFRVAVKVTRHEELPVLVATVDALEAVTLQTEEGKVLTKVVYKVRNNVKQFLRLDLPGKATVWSVFVSGQPVKPAKDENGSILVPLEKSQTRGETLTQFPVEIVYLDETPKMSLTGTSRLRLPKADLPTSELIWSVFLPWDYRYLNFDGDVRQVKRHAARQMARRLAGPFTGTLAQTDETRQQWGGRDKGDFMMREAEQQVMVTSQFAPAVSVESFREEVGKVAGMMPIKISVPRQGRHYRFSKLLITDKESPWVSFRYVKIYKHIGTLLRLAGLIFVIVVVIRVIRKRRAARAA